MLGAESPRLVAGPLGDGVKLLPMAPLTYEDVLIWARILKRNVDLGCEGWLIDACEAADRRDAALMLQAQVRRGARMLPEFDWMWVRGLPRSEQFSQ